MFVAALVVAFFLLRFSSQTTPTTNWGNLPTVTPPGPGEPTLPPDALAMQAAPTATPGSPPSSSLVATLTFSSTPLPTPTPVSPVGHDDVPMVEISAGEFIMGNTFDDTAYRSWVYVEDGRVWAALPDRFNDETPQMTVYLDSFEIDQVEVTNARYQHCVDAGICPSVSPPDPQRDTYPATVHWYAAYSYCQWVGKRLPTEAEWEKAARGTDGRRYPWGNEWELTYGAFDGELAPVGSFPQDTSPYGVLDTAGNAGEWTLDIYEGYLGIGQRKMSVTEYTENWRVVRGSETDDLAQLTSRTPAPASHSAFGFRCVRGGPLTELEQAVVSANVPQIPATPAAVDLSDMAYVPAGEFIMGTDEIYVPERENDHRDERPAHIIYLDAYYIDRYPVTYAQFAEFLNTMGTHRGVCDSVLCALVVEEWEEKNEMTLRIYRRDGGYVVEDGYENYPVQDATWEGAQAYCTWLGKRLPTEAEWEKAARGTSGQRYPWGNEWDERSQEDTTYFRHEVGFEPFNVSPYGVHDMLGNGRGELVADWYDPDYYLYSSGHNPTGPETGEFRVLRGGDHAILGITSRRREHNAGFRCASGSAIEFTPFSETYTILGKARLLFGSCFTEVCPHDAGLTSSPQASLPAELAVEFVAN